MGLAPEQIDRMSAWEYNLCIAGWRAANSVDEEDEKPKLSYEQFRYLMDAPPGGYA